MRNFGRKEDAIQPGMTEVDPGRHNTNDLRKRAANGDQLSPEELQRLLEEERPTKTQDRPTGRKTRTGTEVKKTDAGRKHAEKWAERTTWRQPSS